MKFKQTFLDTFQREYLKSKKITKIYLKHLKAVIGVYTISNYVELHKSIKDFELDMNDKNLRGLRNEIQKSELL